MVKMKDSGIEWIGEIPENWNFKKLGRISEIITDGTHQTPNYIDEGFPFISIKDISSGKIDFSDVKYISESQHKELYAHAPVKKGDILFTRIGTLGVFVEVDTDIVFDFFVSVGMIRLKQNIINQHYLIHYLNSPAVGNFIQSIKAGFGTAAPKYNLTDVKRTWILFPPLETQKRIADFLDGKCQKIDLLKNDIQKQIEILEQYKKSLITEAVTKGINPDTKMKDSGIEWIGKIPMHWEVANPKWHFTQRKDRAKRGLQQLTASQKYGVITQDEYMDITGAKVVTVAKDFDILKLVRPGDFVIHMRSFQGGLEYSEKEGSISSAYVMLIPQKTIADHRFYKWFFKSPIYIDALSSTTNLVRDGQAMRYANFIQIPIVIPSAKEQKDIADYLDAKCNIIDSIIASKQHQLETLEEYKKSLIFEYVTGKKEV